MSTHGMEKVKITLKGKGLLYEKDVEQELAAQIMTMCLSASSVPIQKAAIFVTPLSTKESPAEYFNRYAPRSNPDKILTLACYVKEARGVESFQIGTIRTLFKEARVALPSNITRDFQTLIGAGRITRDHEKKEMYYVTGTGLKALQEGFPEAKRKKND